MAKPRTYRAAHCAPLRLPLWLVARQPRNPYLPPTLPVAPLRLLHLPDWNCQCQHWGKRDVQDVPLDLVGPRDMIPAMPTAIPRTAILS